MRLQEIQKKMNLQADNKSLRVYNIRRLTFAIDNVTKDMSPLRTDEDTPRS